MCINFEGRVFKSGRYWIIEIPALNIITQGKSRKDAYAMIKDAVELHVEQSNFNVEIISITKNGFVLSTKKDEDDKFLMALLLKQQRAKHGLSTSEVADRLGTTKHAYAQYEQARNLPSLAKVEEFVHAMNKHSHFTINIFEEAKAA